VSTRAAAFDPHPPGAPTPADGDSGFAGNTSDVALAVVLQLISAGRKTGCLTLARREGYGRLLFREGRIVYASSPTYRTSFGSLLVQRGLATDQELFSALEVQNHRVDDVSLREILVEREVIDARELESVVQERLGSVLADLLSWDTSFFRFDGHEAPETSVDIEGRDFVTKKGLRLAGGTIPPMPRAALRLPDAPIAESPAMDQRAEILDTLLRFASTIVRRGVLFEVRDDRLTEVRRFEGEVSETPELPMLELYLAEPSLFTDVVKGGESYRGPLEASQGNDRLLAALGGTRPSEVVAVPMAVEQRVEMVFYGDNGGGGAALGAVEPLLMVLREGVRELSSSSSLDV